MVISIILSMCIIFYFNLIFCPKFRWLIWCIVFDVLSLYYYINLSLSVIHYLFSGDIYLSFSIFLSRSIFFVSISTVSEPFCGERLETFVVSKTILLLFKSPVDSDVFELLFLKVVLRGSVPFFLAWSRTF